MPPIYFNDDPSKSSKPAPPAADGSPAQMYPEQATNTPWGRMEPLLTPEQLTERYLFGIPLQSRFKDPISGKYQRITRDMLADYIKLALNDAEMETGLSLMPTKFVQKLPYIKQDFEQLGYFRLEHRPISTIDRFSVRLADNSDIFDFPLMWLETSNIIHGQLNILPLAFQGQIAGTGVIGNNAGAGGTAVFFNNLWSRPWVPALFSVEYTTGFPNGLLPTIVNNLIGCIVAMRILSMLAAMYARVTSTSLSIDSMSQSVGSPGPNLYTVRMGEIAEERKLIVRKLKKTYATNFVIGDV